MKHTSVDRKNCAFYTSLPRGGLEGAVEEQLLEILAGVYGFGDSSRHWKILPEAILGLGYKESVIDPTVCFLQTEDKLDGGDCCRGGRPVHVWQRDPRAPNGGPPGKVQVREIRRRQEVPGRCGFQREGIPRGFAQVFVREAESCAAQQRTKLIAKNTDERQRDQPDACSDRSAQLVGQRRTTGCRTSCLVGKPVVQDLLDVNSAVKMLNKKTQDPDPDH